MINCELLAPAGSIQSLIAAVNSGTDAVYLGGSLFNARASATNFNNAELKEAVEYCHLRKVKVYVTVNILITDKEFAELDKFIRYICKIGVDGVIVQDIGVAMYIKKIAPSLNLHASTQMTVYDLEGAKFLKSIGFKRVVLSRELSMEQIKYISQNAGIEIEIFVHGAMCLCYSGQCLMSSVIGGRSGNRGKCAQPCRLEYCVDNKKGFLMSLKDMCLIKYLKEIEDCGVTSLKIEGRMKGPDYVSTVISTYRKYLDNEKSISDADYKNLEKIFYRGGFSDGYYKNSKGKDMFCHTKPDNPYLQQDDVLKFTEKFKKTKINLYFTGLKGKNLCLTAIDEYGNTASYTSDMVLEQAKNAVTTKEKINENLNKLGDTVFETENIEIIVDSDVFIPTSEINKSRRSVVEALENKIIKMFEHPYPETTFYEFDEFDKKNEFKLSISVSTKEQLDVVRKTDCEKIYVPLELGDYKENEILILPRISPDNLEEIISKTPNKYVLVRNIGQLNIARRCNKIIYLDFTMNVFNRVACDFYKKADVKGITLSTELMLKQIKDISKIIECECVIYGKLPIMITENCLIKTSVGCNKRGGYIYDRTNEGFLIKCLPQCRNEIFNSKPIVMSDKLDDIKQTGIAFGRLSFTDESPEECIKIYNSYKNGKKINVAINNLKITTNSSGKLLNWVLINPKESEKQTVEMIKYSIIQPV